MVELIGPKLSAKASITATVALVVLFAVLPSLVALVVPATPMLVCVVSVPLLAVPGIVTVIGQVRVPFGATLAALLPALKTQVPVATVAPAGVPAVALQVGLLAAVLAAMLLQVKLPVNTAPGPAVAGRPVIDTVMSAAAPTTRVAVAVSHAGGVVAGLAQIW